MGRFQVFPEWRRVEEGEEIYGELGLPPAPSPARPYVLVNMVASVDGRISVGEKSSGIGSPVDRSCMRALRSHVDAVMVGAGSLRAEKMKLGLDGPGVPQPLAVIVGGSGDLPLNEHLVIGDQELVVALPQDAPAPAKANGVSASVLRIPGGDGRVDLERLLGALRSELGVRRVLVEGGPGLNRALVDAGLVDEIFLTVAPKLLLGPEHAMLSGVPGGRPLDLTLLSAHLAADELFLRYRLRKPRP